MQIVHHVIVSVQFHAPRDVAREVGVGARREETRDGGRREVLGAGEEFAKSLPGDRHAMLRLADHRLVDVDMIDSLVPVVDERLVVRGRRAEAR